jgi:hypothetical protein
MNGIARRFDIIFIELFFPVTRSWSYKHCTSDQKQNRFCSTLHINPISILEDNQNKGKEREERQ